MTCVCFQYDIPKLLTLVRVRRALLACVLPMLSFLQFPCLRLGQQLGIDVRAVGRRPHRGYDRCLRVRLASGDDFEAMVLVMEPTMVCVRAVALSHTKLYMALLDAALNKPISRVVTVKLNRHDTKPQSHGQAVIVGFV